MNNILKLTIVAAQAAAITSTASAFPYAQPHFGKPPQLEGEGATFALYLRNRGVDQPAAPAPAPARARHKSAAQGAQH